MNPFRRNPTNGAIGVLQGRSRSYKSGTEYYKSATRNPAWIKVTGVGNGCFGSKTMTLPDNTETFDTTYNPSNKFKLGPILKDVTIEIGGEFGLAQSINITIQCHTRDDFEQVEKAFLLPGNTITAQFGYGKSWIPSDQQSVSAGPFRVVTFNFTTTTEGYWIATCKAVAAAEAVKNLEVSSIIKEKGLSYLGGSKKFPVTGMMELIAYDAQKNGEKSIDEMEDGETITPKGAPGALVVYRPDHLYSNMFSTMWGKITFDGKNEAEKTFGIVYLTLEYIIKRLIIGQIKQEIAKGIITKDRDLFNKLDIIFDPEMSVSWTSVHTRSGSPTTCLIMGENKGNYKNQSNEGKNFEKDCKDLSKVKAVVSKSGNRQKIDHRYILLERGIVTKIFAEMVKKREATADTVDVKDTKELVLPVEDFLKKIFDHIGSCTGGAMQLRLTVHPTDTNKLVVIDQNNGYIPGALKVVVFNPIDGDGSTRSSVIQSNVGSEEYKAYMFAGSSRKGDGAASIRGCKPQADTKRVEVHTDAIKVISQLLYNPGALGANHFGAVQESALIQAMGTLAKTTPQSKKYELAPYLGMSIEIELDGVWGFVPGNGISTTQLPPRYLTDKNYFLVKTVTHLFSAEDSTWTTKLSGIMTFYETLEPVRI